MATVAEMVERIIDNLELAGIDAPKHGSLIRRLEASHQRLAQDLQIPRRYHSGADATRPFLLPEEARPSGLLSVEHAEKNRPVSLLTIQEANNIGIAWDTIASHELDQYRGHPHHGRYLVIYDPANSTAPIYPLGFAMGDTLRMVYVKKPEPLRQMTDRPFDGELDEYAGELLVHYVTFQVLMARGLDQAQAFYNDYRQRLDDALASTNPPAYLPRPRPDVRGW